MQRENVRRRLVRPGRMGQGDSDQSPVYQDVIESQQPVQPQDQNIRQIRNIRQRLESLSNQFDVLNISGPHNYDLLYNQLVDVINNTKKQVLQKMKLLNNLSFRQKSQRLKQIGNWYSKKILNQFKQNYRRFKRQLRIQLPQFNIPDIRFPLVIHRSLPLQQNFENIRHFVYTPYFNKAQLYYWMFRNTGQLMEYSIQQLITCFMEYLSYIRKQNYKHNNHLINFQQKRAVNLINDIYIQNRKILYLRWKDKLKTQNIIYFGQFLQIDLIQKRRSNNLTISFRYQYLKRISLTSLFLQKQRQQINQPQQISQQQIRKLKKFINLFINKRVLFQSAYQPQIRLVQSNLILPFLQKFSQFNDFQNYGKHQNSKQRFFQSFRQMRFLIKKYVSIKLRQIFKDRFVDQMVDQDKNISMLNRLIRLPLAVAVCKMFQWWNIIQVGRRNIQDQRSDFYPGYLGNPPQNYTWYFFAVFRIGRKKMYIRFNFNILSPNAISKKSKTLYAPNRRNQINRVVQLINIQLKRQISAKILNYVQFWNVNLQDVSIQVQKLQLMSKDFIPMAQPIIPIRGFVGNYFNLIYYTSSLRVFHWRQQLQLQFLPTKKLWTVYAKSQYQKQQQKRLKQQRQQAKNQFIHRLQIIQQQAQQNIRKYDMDCFTKVLYLILCITSGFRVLPIENFQNYLNQQKSVQKFRKDKDIISLARYLQFNLMFQDRSLRKYDLFFNQSLYCIKVTYAHAQLGLRLEIQTSNQQKQIKKRTASLNPLSSTFKPIQNIKNIYQRQKDCLYEQFHQKIIGRRFAFIDLQTYSIRQQIMPVYLGCIIVWYPTSVLNSHYPKLKNQDIVVLQSLSIGWKKLAIRIHTQNYRKIWFGRAIDTNILDAIAWVMVHTSQVYHLFTKQPLTWWTFNGLTFDYCILFGSLIKLVQKFKSYGPVNDSKGFTNKIMTLQDARNFFAQGSLKKLTKQNCVDYKKIKFDIGRISNYKQWIQKKAQIIKYCDFDCLSLQELMGRFYWNIWRMIHQIGSQRIQQKISQGKQAINWNIGGYQLLSRPTLSNFALFFFQLLFLGAKYTPHDQPHQIQQQKQSFSGGMVQVNRHYIRKGQKVYQIDANSMYPSNQKYLPLWPYKNQIWQRIKQAPLIQFQKFFMQQVSHYLISQYWGKKDFMQMVDKYETQIHFDQKRAANALTNRYKIRSILYPNNYQFLPFIASQWQKQGIYYPRNISKQKWVSGFAIYQLLRSGCIFQLVDIRLRSSWLGQQFKNQIWQFSKYCYNKRQQFKSKKLSGLQLGVKLVLNSLYGMFLKKKFPNINIQTVYQRIEQYQIGNEFFQQFSEFIQQNVDDNPYSGDMITVASQITQLARVKISSIVRQVGIQNFFYCDTDSVYLNDQGVQKLKNLMPDLLGKQLGKWKVQNPDNGYTIGHFISRKCMVLRSSIFTYKFQGKKHYVQFNPQIQIQNYRQYYQKQIKQGEFQQDEIKFQQWIRDKVYKIRMKGINFKPLPQACQFIIQRLYSFYEENLKSQRFNHNLFMKKMQIPVSFQTTSWKRNWGKKGQIGVIIASMVKIMSYNFKRIPLITGQTLAVNQNILNM